jgi:hypothetical protein
MNAATKRTIIATAALAAAGLFGSLPYEGSTQAQQGAPTVHRDVALVDITTLLTDEGTFDTALVTDVSGAETTLYNDLSTTYSPTVANTLLDTTTGGAGDFNGAETQGFDGLLTSGLVTEDQVNQLLGVTETASQTAILADFVADGGTIPASSDVTLADLTAAVGTSAFDTDLTSIANADYSLAFTDFEGYLSSFATDTSGLSDVSTLLTDLTSSFSDLTNLTPDLTSILTDLGGLL